ncbi:hypothetical protein E4U42_002784 [Claviceps africana]|uniref:Uncharacterized protein n=1 Tax=Claviceps africana TaxID=83212 RepID=A0A8K0JA83_9HYPO|nr:hypothetical protein E4U42_002784 [Claviceps africana]
MALGGGLPIWSLTGPGELLRIHDPDFACRRRGAGPKPEEPACDSAGFVRHDSENDWPHAVLGGPGRPWQALVACLLPTQTSAAKAGVRTWPRQAGLMPVARHGTGVGVGVGVAVAEAVAGARIALYGAKDWSKWQTAGVGDSESSFLESPAPTCSTQFQIRPLPDRHM